MKLLNKLEEQKMLRVKKKQEHCIYNKIIKKTVSNKGKVFRKTEIFFQLDQSLR